MIENNLDTVPLFVLPADFSGLVFCLGVFLLSVVGIVWFEKFWIKRDHYVDKHERNIQRILLWEFGSVVSLIVIYILKLYCVVLPLLFLITVLSMWYLVDTIHRKR